MKHYVRTRGWLPVCIERKRDLTNRKPKDRRRVRYFTFCAVGATDVLMLDVAQVLRRSREGLLDTVVFFDRKIEDVAETKRRIPGAVGIPGDFVKITLTDNPVRDRELVAAIASASGSDQEPRSDQSILSPPENELDTSKTRERQVELAQHTDFIKCFPFDIMNFDLEQFLFRPGEDVPGRLVNALRRVFEWQRDIPLVIDNRAEFIDTFSFMFTTRLGPPQLPEVKEYTQMLSGYLEANVRQHDSLREAFKARTGTVDIESYLRSDFGDYFCLSVPKLLSNIASEADWYVEPKRGFNIFKFDRNQERTRYTMFHVVAEMKRKKPPRGRRPPGDPGVGHGDDSYIAVVQKLFGQKPEMVTEEVSNATILKPSMEAIIRRREGYMNGTMQA
jgi:hypothetical protein